MWSVACAQGVKQCVCVHVCMYCVYSACEYVSMCTERLNCACELPPCLWHTDALLIRVCVSVFSYLLVLLWFHRWINVWTESHGRSFITFGSLCSINTVTAWFLFTWLLSSLSDVKMKTASFVIHLLLALYVFSLTSLSFLGPLWELMKKYI